MLSHYDFPSSGTPAGLFAGVPDLCPPAPALLGPPAAPAATEFDAFGRIVSLYQSNAYLLSELEGLRVKRTRAAAYRRSTGCNPALADARIAQLRARHSAVLTMLRANRVAARTLLGHAPPGPLAGT